jgi:SAM-dependent methyltransferase|tara:strand:+ start:5855 stop:6517 length:663 start_codon:yes stop_codon:yes gene_type:complete
MLVEEAIWIKNQIENHFNRDDFPLLNIGSSTKKFREEDQSHIFNHIFSPLEEKKLKVIHSDIKQLEGVDIVGNINDKSFRESLKKKNIKSIICSNLLEHVENPILIIKSILDILPDNGKLIVTTPFYFPYHKDPIDTLFRPNIEELELLFSGLQTITSSSLISKKNLFQVLKSNPKYFLRMILRWFIPFYKFHDWKLHFKDLFKLRKNFSANCIVFKKTS